MPLILTSQYMSNIVGKTKRQLISMLNEGSTWEYNLAKQLDISQPSVHEHLADLEDAGLIERDERGDRIYYSLTENGNRFSTVLQEMNEYRASQE